MDEWWTITEKSFNFVIKLRWSMGEQIGKGGPTLSFEFFFFCIYICFMEMRIVQEGCKLQSRFCFCIFVFGILSTLFSFTPTSQCPHPPPIYSSSIPNSQTGRDGRLSNSMFSYGTSFINGGREGVLREKWGKTLY